MGRCRATRLNCGLEPGPTLVDMVTTGNPNPVVTISTRVGPGSRLDSTGAVAMYTLLPRRCYKGKRLVTSSSAVPNQFLLFFHPGCSGMCCFTCAALLGPLRGRNSCCLWFWQLVFGVSLRDATSNLPSSRNPLSSRNVLALHDGRKHKTVVSSQPNALREEARRTNLQLLAIGCHADCSGERRTSPFNGIERSLSRVVVIKTKSLPVSATTFPTALSLYIAHDGRKHKHNPTLSVNKHVVKICRSSLSAAPDGLADGSGKRGTSPVNGTERSLSRAVQ